jgi:hypothetical protein
MEMPATDDADSRTASPRRSRLSIQTHRSGTGFGASPRHPCRNKTSAPLLHFGGAKSHDAVANKGDSGWQSVGKIGDKQTSE